MRHLINRRGGNAAADRESGFGRGFGHSPDCGGDRFVASAVGNVDPELDFSL
jgi:hypothetical protein